MKQQQVPDYAAQQLVTGWSVVGHIGSTGNGNIAMRSVNHLSIK